VSDSSRAPWEARLSRRDALLGAGGLILVGGLAACGSSGTSGSTSTGGAASTAASTGATAGPKPGGTLRVGVPGAGAKDIIDGQNIVAKSDQARLLAGWETLLTYDRDYKLTNDGLAESVEAEAPDSYVIKLKQGIEFHNGKTLGADDVIYSIKRLLDPDLKLFGGAALGSVDLNQLAKVDDLTVRMKLTTPDSTIRDALAQYVAGIVPDGYDSKGTSVDTGQIGTGPFTLKSFAPGKESVHLKFANYWKEGQPYLDQVTITNIDDPAARVNALISDAVDVIADIPFAQVPVVKGNAAVVLFENEGGGWLPLCMAVDQEPFTDVRVRQAFRLIVDRQQMVDQALAGHGRIANDLYGPFDPCYRTDLPQRAQDLEQAKQLLKDAGKEGLKIDLVTSDQATGMVEMAKVFAEQAKGAGVTVNVKILDGATFYGDQYLKWTFSNDYWGTRNYLNQVAAGSLHSAPYDESHWPPAGSDFEDLYKQAISEPDDAKRCTIIGKMMQEEYDEGGYVIPFFNNLIDAYSTKVTGFQKNRGTLNLDGYGRNWAEISFA
jgi:peptide/nickel transport system substrate-binding protein